MSACQEDSGQTLEGSAPSILLGARRLPPQVSGPARATTPGAAFKLQLGTRGAFWMDTFYLEK